jgi:hypothetical protein
MTFSNELDLTISSNRRRIAMSKTVTDFTAGIATRLVAYLERNQRCRESTLYNTLCGPNYPLTRTQFAEIAAELDRQGLIERSTTRPYGGCFWLTRKDKEQAAHV